MAAAHYDQSIGADCPNRSETVAVPGDRNRMGGGHGWCYRRHRSDTASVIYRTEAVAERVIARCIEMIDSIKKRGVLRDEKRNESHHLFWLLIFSLASSGGMYEQ